MNNDPAGVISDIDDFALHDGPSLRTAVNFMGCPKKCAWYYSPDSQLMDLEYLRVPAKCRKCGICMGKDCHYGATVPLGS